MQILPCNCFFNSPHTGLVVPSSNMFWFSSNYRAYKRNALLAFAAGAVLKFIALYFGVVKIVLPFFLPANAPEKIRAVLSVQFSWPQLITASIGSLLAAIVLPILRKAVKEL